MKKYLILLFMLPMMVQAQKADSIQFEMIKTAVHFYTTDPVFNKVQVHASTCMFPDYKCLTEFCKINDLTNVEDKIDLWKDPKCNNKDQLEKLKERILNDLVANNKGYRKTLPEYSVFIKNMDAILAGFKSQENSQSIKPSGIPDLDTAFVNKVAPAVIKKLKENNDLPNSLLIWGALVAGLGGLLLGIWSLVNKPKKSPKITDGADAGSDAIGKLEARVAALNTQLPLKADASVFNSVEQRIADIETWMKQVKNKEQEKPVSANTKPAQTKTPSAPPAKKSETFYAKMPDLPNGFSNDILRNEQNGEQVYEITVSDNSAVYSVSGDVPAQHYALNDVNYILGRACTLSNQPFANCRINTKLNGTLTKTTEGWIFENKALVEFM